MAEQPVFWERVEPRRLYRATVDGRTYSLGYRGRAAAPDPGWYLIGGLDGKGNVFMAKRLRDAADEAARQILAR